ncbi:MAG: hypothetical protein AMS24_05400 [Chlamydiae bacterium SM23_39]|nr:MAG: hypothetical protein AMS24_05400 [Chlamydiae bacterium SM23_39]
MKKVGRNDPCPCGSGKKFKKCCERKMIGKKFMATKIEPEKKNVLSSFFKKKIFHIKKKGSDEKS